MRFSRRSLLTGMAAMAGGLALGFPVWRRHFATTDKIKGGIVGAADRRGHGLRTLLARPSRTEECDVVIVGSGIAGLSAARHLQQNDINNFIMLELEDNIGGNAQGGANDVSAYPWGAHYVTLAPVEAVDVQKFYEEAGIITGYDAQNLPVYNEYYLCADPHERLLIHGRWQEGIMPQVGVSDEELAQYKRFLAQMDEFSAARGSDGKRAFVIPIDDSSQDDKFLSLDQLTMTEWMAAQGYTSPHLLWVVDYSCRDDFGTRVDETSAWAAIHYFAARNGVAANTAPSNVLTWPDGNGFIVGKLADNIKDKIRTQTGVYKIEKAPNGVEVFCSHHDEFYSIKAKAVVLAIPRFIAKYLTGGDAHDFTYAPWAVANITLSKSPAGNGADLSWDNVVYNSRLLGYVVATHQSLQRVPQKTVITYYWPLTHAPHDVARKELHAASYETLRHQFLDELLRIHPELDGAVERVDIWRWGHGMIRPVKGFMWGQSRRDYLKQHAPIFHAHSDMSGISIFEEAFTHGIRTARDVVRFVKRQG